MAWVLTRSLAALNAAFDEAFPNRGRDSDGTIGDAAHRAEVSGHNPDDTPGVAAEYSDPDSKAEVRATDRDKDLNDPRGVTMQQVIDKILATPADRARLRYVIYNQRIASRNTGWAWRAYSGANKHTEHAHFSGDPDTDEDGSPWLSVLSFKQEASMAEIRQEDWDNLRWREFAVDISPEFDEHGVAHVQGGPAKGQAAWLPTFLRKLWTEVVQGALDEDNVLHWRLRGMQDSEDAAIVNGPFGAPKAPGLKQLGDGQAKLAEGIAAVSQKVDGLAAVGGGLSDEDRSAIQALTAAVNALNSRLASP